MWTRLWMILGREGAYTRTSGCFYIVVAQSTLIFGSEMWFVTPRMARTLGGFPHQVARYIIGKLPKIHLYVIRIYPPFVGAMQEAGIE